MAIDTVHGNRTVSQLQEQIVNLCDKTGLRYDGSPPTPVGPGVWMIYTTEMDLKCSKHGHCRQSQRFVVQLGERVVFG